MRGSVARQLRQHMIETELEENLGSEDGSECVVVALLDGRKKEREHQHRDASGKNSPAAEYKRYQHRPIQAAQLLQAGDRPCMGSGARTERHVLSNRSVNLR